MIRQGWVGDLPQRYVFYTNSDRYLKELQIFEEMTAKNTVMGNKSYILGEIISQRHRDIRSALLTKEISFFHL